jgi:hypothetical protein
VHPGLIASREDESAGIFFSVPSVSLIEITWSLLTYLEHLQQHVLQRVSQSNLERVG